MVEAATSLALVAFCLPTGVPGAILGLMLCTADQDSGVAGACGTSFPSHFSLHKGDLHILTQHDYKVLEHYVALFSAW